jgi:hypothetical protein
VGFSLRREFPCAMKITTLQVRQAAPALQELAALALPSATALRVMLTIRALKDPMAAFDEVWNKMLADHGTPIEGQPGQFEITKIVEFTAAAKELNEQELDVPVKPIEFAALAPFALKPNTLLALDWFITGLDEEITGE